MTGQRRASPSPRGPAAPIALDRDALLLAALLVGSLVDRPALPLADVAPRNLIVPLCAVALAWRHRAGAWPALRAQRPLLLATGALYAWTWISAALGEAPAHSLRYAAKYGSHVLVFVCLLAALRGTGAGRRALPVAYWFLVGVAALGIVEYVAPALFDAAGGRSPVYPRVASLLFWPNQLGVLAAVALALGIALWREGHLAARAVAIGSAALVLTLALAASRNGWGVCLVLLALLRWRGVLSSHAAAAVAAGLALAVLTFPAPAAQLGIRHAALPLARHLTGAESTANGTSPPADALLSRRALWSAAWQHLRQHPVTGIGLEAFATGIGPHITGQPWINTHNLALNVAVELGLVGLVLFAVWLAVLARAGDRADPTTALPLLGLGLGQMVDCFIYDPTFMTCTALLAACYATRSRPAV